MHLAQSIRQVDIEDEGEIYMTEENEIVADATAAEIDFMSAAGNYKQCPIWVD